MHRKNFIGLITGVFKGLIFVPLISCDTQPSQLINKESMSSPLFLKATQGVKLNVIGDNQLIKLTGKDTNNQFTLVEQDNMPGTGIPPHVHQNEDEVFKVNAGTVEFTIGEKTETLTSGDLVFCPRGVPHSFRVVGTDNAKVSLSIFPSGLENMFEELSQLPSGRPDMSKVAEICGRYNITFI